MLLNPCGELPRGLSCVALGSIDDRRLFTWVDSIFDSHQSAAQGSCWTMGNSNSACFQKTMVAIYGISCHMLGLATVLQFYSKKLGSQIKIQLINAGVRSFASGNRVTIICSDDGLLY